MNMNPVERSLFHLIAAATLVLSACASSGPTGIERVSIVEAPGRVIIVDTFATIVRVSAIDAAKRKMTLVSPDGRKTTYKAGPEVVNFDQIQVGDMIKVVLTEQAAVFIGRGAPPSSSGSTGIVLAPAGSKPGGVLVDTTQVTARVAEVDVKARKVTFELPDGSSRKVKVGTQVDLSTVNPGDTVTVQVSEGLAVSVEKP